MTRLRRALLLLSLLPAVCLAHDPPRNSLCPFSLASNGEIFALKAIADPQAAEMEDRLAERLRSTPVLRERPDLQVPSGYNKTVYELVDGSLILFQAEDPEDEFSRFQINGETLYYEASRFLNINGVSVVVRRRVGEVEGAARYYYTSDELNLESPLPPSFAIRLLDWIVNYGDRHRGNVLHHRSGWELAIDHGWAFEPNGGVAHFIWHGNHRPWDPFQPEYLDETIKTVRQWSSDSILQLIELFKARLDPIVVSEITSRLLSLLLAAYPGEITFAQTQAPQQPRSNRYVVVSTQSIQATHRQHMSIDIHQMTKAQPLSGAQLRLTADSEAGAQVRVHLNEKDGPVVAVMRIPRNALTRPREYYFDLSWLPLGTRTLVLEFIEHRQMADVTVAAVEEIAISGSSSMGIPTTDQTITDIEVGQTVRVGGEDYVVLQYLTRGDVGNAYRVMHVTTREIRNLKVAVGPEKLTELLDNEPLRLSIYHNAGFSEFPRIHLTGSNFILKDFVPGITGEEWLTNFDPSNIEDRRAIDQLIRLMILAAQRGVLVSFRNPRNLAWTGERWIVFDPSYRTQVSDNPAALLERMTQHLREGWQSCKPLFQIVSKENWALDYLKAFD
ncbi:MAG: hypothetical protein AB7G93_11270 [Bdellovibrionales bacterium]